MLCADWRIASLGAQHRFGLVDARAGLALPTGALAVAQHHTPAPLLRQMSLSALMLGVEDLRLAGLIDDAVVPEPANRGSAGPQPNPNRFARVCAAQAAGARGAGSAARRPCRRHGGSVLADDVAIGMPI